VQFQTFFEAATGQAAYEYQCELASLPLASRAIGPGTGAGKTAAVILAWLWNRCALARDPAHAARWPRRLVYCLPMRTLVEQTRREAGRWLAALKERRLIDPAVAAFTLMGGALEETWQRHPERPAVLIGTQDMLLSRALNRGYAMSRYRRPLHFALLNNDCLWVADEVQLMGPAFETTLQLDALRPHRWGTYGKTCTWWMSATLDEKRFETTDRLAVQRRLGTGLLADSSAIRTAVEGDPRLKARLNAPKRVSLADREPKPADVVRHHRPGTLTLVIFNTVKGARKLFRALLADRTLHHPTQAKNPSGVDPGSVRLLHSQFRPGDRGAVVDRLLEFEALRRGGHAPAAGLILVTSRVIEAGVDASACRLWSQVAPWASVVQRLGRLNRDGRDPDAQGVFWLDAGKNGRPKDPLPYDVDELTSARDRLATLEKDPRNVGDGHVGDRPPLHDRIWRFTPAAAARRT
jgi:CRISPR-associated endonuclease/helicase Cas3